jgi:hypothetical protein
MSFSSPHAIQGGAALLAATEFLRWFDASVSKPRHGILGFARAKAAIRV